MPLNRWLGIQEAKLHPGMLCPGGCEPLTELQDPFVARLWLRLLKGDVAKMSAVRALLRRDLLWSEPWKLTDDSLIERVAEQLSRGWLHAHASVPIGGASGGVVDQPISEAPAEPRRPPPPREPRVSTVQEEVRSLEENADEVAIAEALKLASASGMPFCEECMRAQLQNNRAGAFHG